LNNRLTIVQQSFNNRSIFA